MKGMETLDIRDFMFRQPDFPRQSPTDRFYFDVACCLLEKYNDSVIGQELPEGTGKRFAMCLSGYFQDIIADAGIWRSFVDANRRMYGYSVPFQDDTDEYVDYELNAEDVRFLTWYVIAMSCEEKRQIYPHDEKIMELASCAFDYLESIYEEAPEPEGYNLARGLELNDPEDKEAIYHFGSWLFLHCYLMTPAFGLTLTEIMSDPELMQSDDVTKLHNRMERSMMEDPTGPLAFFIPEWLQLILEGKLPSERVPDKGVHPYYEKFIVATGGKRIQYFKDYEEMNRFFIDSMGWDKNQEHLPVLKNDCDFVVLVNPRRGMLVARNAARCIADPDNPLYDRGDARRNAFDFLTVRGRCPADLVKFAFENHWLPDAVFPGTDDNSLVERNHDFIARCYLQQYYRD